MKRILQTTAALMLAMIWAAPEAQAVAPDRYIGDTAIYGASDIDLQHNVLIILDTSTSMNDETLPGDPYLPAEDYTGVSGPCGGQPCDRYVVYKCTAFGNECGNWTATVADVGMVTTACGTDNPRDSLQTTGQWNSSNRRLLTDGTCKTGSGIYALGNWINWRDQISTTPTPKIDIAKDVLKNLILSTSGVSFGVMVFDQNGSAGAQFWEKPVDGTNYVTTIKNMTAIHTGTTKNQDALVYAVSGDGVYDGFGYDGVEASGWTPLAESLFEAMQYFKGAASAFSNSIGINTVTGKYVSPIAASCQKNFVIVITDGMSTQDQDGTLQTICTTAQGYAVNGDCDRDGFEPEEDPAKTYSSSGSDYLDDVAYYLNQNDMASWLPDTQNVITYTVGFGLGGSNAGAVKLLDETAKNGDYGNPDAHAYYSNDQAGLLDALTQILGNISSVNTSFVAPVVPVSPDNRTYSGSRVYMGFFKPRNGKAWYGNLKKFGIDDYGNIIDVYGNLANFVDMDRDGDDDRDGYILPAGYVHGSFRASTLSYWSTDLTNPVTFPGCDRSTAADKCYGDGGEVEIGGIGEVLQTQALSRTLYTYFSPYNQFIDSHNAVALSNLYHPTTNPSGLIDPSNATTGLDFGWAADPYKAGSNLLVWLQGRDVYDDDGDKVYTENRWPLGDILHSKPVVVNYASYDISVAAYERDCNINKAIIYVGANDGALHAFRDCDGSEAWAFIPPDFLPGLRWQLSKDHYYFLDSSVTTYIVDHDGDQNIEPSADPAKNDLVLLVFGARRGSGKLSEAGEGWYWALNVTNPLKPTLMWKIKTGYAGFDSELGESWSEPKLGKIRIGDRNVIALFLGGGYDNCNEDARFGNTQLFPGECAGATTGDAGVATSVAVGAQKAPARGRALYVIEMMEVLPSGVLSYANSKTVLKKFSTASGGPTMNFSVPADIAPLDTDYDGYVDRLYAVDTGGNVFRYEIGDTATANWYGRHIFSANPASTTDTDRGRKAFYRPAVTLEVDGALIYFGTGDREHPLNRSVVDRMYAFYDRGQTVTKYEVDLVDVTLDLIQGGTEQQMKDQIAALADPNKFGWFIRLDQRPGEKVLASPLVYNKMAFFTTYAPNTAPSLDPCEGGNLGTGRVYVVDYKNGNAVLNYNKENDSQYDQYKSNPYAAQVEGEVLIRDDRVVDLPPGGGIPSEPRVVTTPGGDSNVWAGSGGTVPPIATGLPGGVLPIYWKQR